jgi:hypothetical protein
MICHDVEAEIAAGLGDGQGALAGLYGAGGVTGSPKVVGRISGDPSQSTLIANPLG